MEWQQWQSVSFVSRDRLPECSGVYVVADCNNFVWYVGQAENLKSRWLGRGHHRYPQLIRTNKKLAHRIYWKTVSTSVLNNQEHHYIRLFRPELNGCKVKTYLPKKPQHEREIKRLLKTLNNTTLLFPILRSVVVGYSIEDSGTHHILIVTTLNDLSLLEKSMQKRSSSVRQSWDIIYSHCGKTEEQYKPLPIGIYTISDYCFEFVAVPELLDTLRYDPHLYKRCVCTSELLEVNVQALTGLTFIDSLGLQEAYEITIFDGTKPLKGAAYLNYRKQHLQPLRSPVLSAISTIKS